MFFLVNESINYPPTDVPPTDDPSVDPEEGGEEYWYLFNATEHVSFGSMVMGCNEGFVSFGIDTNDPDLMPVEITVYDASEINKGFFVSGDQPLSLPLPLQVKGGDVVEYRNLNCTGVVLTYPVFGNTFVGFKIDSLYLNQPVPNLAEIVKGDYGISLEYNTVFL